MKTAEDLLRADFRNWMYMVWKHLNLPHPTPVQNDIAVWLQHGPRRAVIEGFRGVGKSWITAAYVTWLLYCDADHKIMVVSASKQKADEFSTFCLRLIKELPATRHLIPRADQRESMVSFDVNGAAADISPSVKSVGITGQLTGSRANTIISDDIEVPHNSDTTAKRERLTELIKEFDAVLKPGGRVIYLGTPQTEDSIYNELPSRGYVVRVWPSEIPADVTRYQGRLAPYIIRLMTSGAKAGDPVDPDRFDKKDLQERALSYGRSGYALQFLLDTALSDADRYPLKLSDLIVYPCDPMRAPTDVVWASSPELLRGDLPMVGMSGDRLYRPAWVCGDYAPYQGSVMFVDPSGRGKDETAYAVVKQLNGKLYLTASGGTTDGYEDSTLSMLIAVAKKHDVKHIMVEPNYGGGMFTKMLQAKALQMYPCRVEDAEWSQVSKEMRIIDVLEPVLNQHRLIVDAKVIQDDYDSVSQYETDKQHEYRLFYQLTRMVRQKGALARDDRVDALAGAVAYWIDHLAKDSEQAALQHREDKLNEVLQKFVDHCNAVKGAGSVSRPAASTTLHRARTGRR